MRRVINLYFANQPISYCKTYYFFWPIRQKGQPLQTLKNLKQSFYLKELVPIKNFITQGTLRKVPCC